jgi:plastocyanin
MRRIAVLAAAAALALAACGGDDEEEPVATEAATEAPTEAAAGGASTLAIAADPTGSLAFTETEYTATAGEVTVEFANEAQVPHAVEIDGIDGSETETVTGADAPPLTVDLPAGEYTIYCPVGNHRTAGMEAKLVVR